MTIGESVIRAAAERVVHKRRCVNGVMLYDSKAADAIGGIWRLAGTEDPASTMDLLTRYWEFDRF
ncbi:hypothetical protein MY1884_007437, partial [Beauveria asiatica]